MHKWVVTDRNGTAIGYVIAHNFYEAMTNALVFFLDEEVEDIEKWREEHVVAMLQ